MAATWLNLKNLVRDHVQLALLEVQRAGLSFAKIVGAAIVIAVLVITAWMGVLTSVVVWIVGEGASLPLALLLAAIVNLVAAGLLVWWIRSQVPELLFAATLRQLRSDREGESYRGPADRHEQTSGN